MGTYRVTMVVAHLGWVDLDLRCSIIVLGQYVAMIAANSLSIQPQVGELLVQPAKYQP